MGNIAGLIRRRLPQLEQLTWNIPVRLPGCRQNAVNFRNVLPSL
jgi:hypothetical protein